MKARHRGRWNPLPHWGGGYCERNPWRKKGRHRGVYPYALPRGMGYGLGLPGFHRGKCVEKAEWSQEPKQGWTAIGNGNLVWEGEITLTPEPEYAAYFTLTPKGGTLSIPALTGPPPEPQVPTEADIREIVQDELAATPIYTALRYEDYGRWGDSDIDRVDNTDICVVVAEWPITGEIEFLAHLNEGGA